jgi:hypothetical protein
MSEAKQSRSRARNSRLYLMVVAAMAGDPELHDTINEMSDETAEKVATEMNGQPVPVDRPSKLLRKKRKPRN